MIKWHSQHVYRFYVKMLQNANCFISNSSLLTLPVYQCRTWWAKLYPATQSPLSDWISEQRRAASPRHRWPLPWGESETSCWNLKEDEELHCIFAQHFEQQGSFFKHIHGSLTCSCGFIGAVESSISTGGWADVHVEEDALLQPEGVVFISNKDRLLFASVWHASEEKKMET